MDTPSTDDPVAVVETGRPEPAGDPVATEPDADAAEHAVEDIVPVRSRRRGRRALRQAVEWTVLIGSALVIALLIQRFAFQPFWIPSASMYPTLQEGDRVIVNKLSYKLHDVHRGDIVVFEAPPGEGSPSIKDFVKRVVGLPGDEVDVHDGHVYIDGEQLPENYLPEGTITTPGAQELPMEVPAGSVFVMGDNRSDSRDSREFGPIPESSVVGRVFVRLWPLNRFDML